MLIYHSDTRDGPADDGLASIGRPELATLVLAVIRALIMDLEATADVARTDRAFADFVHGLDESMHTGPPVTGQKTG